MELLEVNVLFYSNKRKSLPCPFDYRPHFVVNGKYLGVQFVECDLTTFDKFGTAIVKLVYDGVDYSPLTENALFDIVEGSTVVGIGIVGDEPDIEQIYKICLQMDLPVEYRHCSEADGYVEGTDFYVIAGKSDLGQMELFIENGNDSVLYFSRNKTKKFSEMDYYGYTHWHPSTNVDAINDLIALMTNNEEYFHHEGYSSLLDY